MEKHTRISHQIVIDLPGDILGQHIIGVMFA